MSRKESSQGQEGPVSPTSYPSGANLGSQEEDFNKDKMSRSEYGRDSGFLSGPCTTESDISYEMSTSDLGGSLTTSSHSAIVPHHKPSLSMSSNVTSSSSGSAGKSMSISNYSRLDSGVDVSVSESLSGLNIDEEEEGKCEGPSAAVLSEKVPSWQFFFQPDEDGDTQLHIAIMEGNESFVFSLISLVPHPSVLDFQNNLSQTCVHVAVLCRQPRIVRRLVAAGAKVDMRDRNGNTPLHLAASLGDELSFQALSIALSSQEIHQCQLRYEPFAQKLPQQIDLTNYDGQGAIHLAALGGHSHIVRALHWLGTEINAKEGKGGRTPLHYAVERGHLNVLRVLVSECGADLEAENYGGLTAYQLAAGVSDSSPLAVELRSLGAVPLDLPMDDEDSSDDDDEEEMSLPHPQNQLPIPH